MKRVFISSVVSGFEEFRQAARRAVELMGDRPIMSEDFGARPYSSEKACISEVEAADVYVAVLGEKYGFETEGGISVTQAEFNAAKKVNKPILVFIQDVLMEKRQQEFKIKVEDFQSGLFRAVFSSPEELKDEIIRALKQIEISHDAPTEDEFNVRQKEAYNESEGFFHYAETELSFSFWPQPLRSVDLNKAESELDGVFGKLCGTGLVLLKDGYSEVKEKNYVGIKSEKTRYLTFHDGLVLITLDPTLKREGSFFDTSFVPPTRVKVLGEGVSQIVDFSGAWCGIRLKGMDGKSIEELPPEGTSSFGIRMFGDNEAQMQKLFVPMTQGAFLEWVDYCIGRFKRIFSK